MALFGALTEPFIYMPQFLCVKDKSFATVLAPILLYLTMLQSMRFKVPLLFRHIFWAVRARHPGAGMFFNVSVHVTFVFEMLATVSKGTCKPTSIAVCEEMSLILTLKWEINPTGFAHERT